MTFPAHDETATQWFSFAKHLDIRTGPIARPFARSLACLLTLYQTRWQTSSLMSQNKSALNHRHSALYVTMCQ